MRLSILLLVVLVKFTDLQGNNVFINPDTVFSVESKGAGMSEKTLITTEFGEKILVDESVFKVKEKLEKHE